MSAKTDSNHKFLYAVIKHSVGSVDYKAVAKATNMTEGAARMRMSRLKKSMDTTVDKDAKVDPKAAKSEDKAPSDSDAPIPKKRRQLKRGKDVSKTESPADD
ncbi:hypothetical protein P168DRAFT_125897 [Aspergillus campestris IBT 28561]|uniref:Myb-like DNA-binding domain-containing protein n=1 Tax=Aspergillus campestris (strain IBT 28561) TaxID=1392248 RepID=A0A2I1D6K5_ASPC2|nr:uncharacterized protein P168DRAFT_125897 [Aspergillus campestris IBT 28561]PKY05511.1 hypothetical protein P168DRAFT_125897 [Aspergillus campestris IBT 28561]